MGLWSGLRSLFGGSDKIGEAAVSAVSGIGKGIDLLVLTDEERLQYSQKGAELYLKYMDLALDQNSIRSVTRRWLAWSVMAVELLLLVVSGLLHPVNAGWATHLFALATTLAPWAGGIMIFYFGPHILTSLTTKKG